MLRDGVVEMLGPRAEIIARVTRGNVPASTPMVAGAAMPKAEG